jgi:hypothetical protein
VSAPLVIGAMQKFELVRTLLERERDASHGQGMKPTLLDVGCRGCGLKPFVDDLVAYQGADLFQNPEKSVTHVLDLEQPLPFPDGHFDFVTALDVVEHVDGLDAAVEELVRVARRAALIMLPNNACIYTRLQFLATSHISEKYTLSYPTQRDRHRWFTTLEDADRYFDDFSAAHGASVDRVYYMDGPRKTRVSKVLRALGAPAQWWTWATLHILRPGERAGAPGPDGVRLASR